MTSDEHLGLQDVVLNVRPQDCVQRNTWRWVTQHWHCWASSTSDVVRPRYGHSWRRAPYSLTTDTLRWTSPTSLPSRKQSSLFHC